MCPTLHLLFRQKFTLADLDILAELVSNVCKQSVLQFPIIREFLENRNERQPKSGALWIARISIFRRIML